MKLSRYFTLAEMIASDTAARLGLDNTPNPQVVSNLKHLCVNLLDPIRVAANSPIIVSSGYRSPEVNRRIGGARTSQHQYGFAADIKPQLIDNKRLYDLILWLERERGLAFDQIIQEFWSPAHGMSLTGGGWIHVSLLNPDDPSVTRPNRQEKLKAARVGGKVVYTKL